MDTTRTPAPVEAGQEEVIESLMRLTPEERHNLLMMAAGMSIARELTTKKE